MSRVRASERGLIRAVEGKERRRTKVIAHAFGERAVLKLMYAALIRASETWERVVISEFELKQMESLREHLNRVHTERTAAVKLSASRSRIPSKNGTVLTPEYSRGCDSLLKEVAEISINFHLNCAHLFYSLTG